ncbi:MAG: hypothetical protein ABF651_08030 [Sporolactobacillus sp.]
MKQFIYQLAGHSEWVDQIKRGIFAFPEHFSLQQRQAITEAVQLEDKQTVRQASVDSDWGA